MFFTEAALINFPIQSLPIDVGRLTKGYSWLNTVTSQLKTPIDFHDQIKWYLPTCQISRVVFIKMWRVRKALKKNVIRDVIKDFFGLNGSIKNL